MFSRKKKLFKKYSKYIDVNVIYQALFGLASILCAILSCVFDYSLSAFFGVMKDVFGTLMVFVLFAVAMHHLRDRFGKKKEKLDYIDFWDDYKADIYGNDVSFFLKPLVYGLQSATYSIDETKKLHDHMSKLLDDPSNSTPPTVGILRMVRAMLDLFIKTERLTYPLKSKEDFEEIKSILSFPCEDFITDDIEFCTWCRILRIDKLELAYELYANGLPEEKKEEKELNLHLALEKCKECNILLESQSRKNPDDKYYALFYLSYVNRNIAQIHHELHRITGNEIERNTSNKYILIAYNYRKELYDYFKNVRKVQTLNSDYVTQEYVLALSEKCTLETNPTIKQDLEKEIHESYDKWVLQSKARNMLLEKIKHAINTESLRKE